MVVNIELGTLNMLVCAEGRIVLEHRMCQGVLMVDALTAQGHLSDRLSTAPTYNWS